MRKKYLITHLLLTFLTIISFQGCKKDIVELAPQPDTIKILSVTHANDLTDGELTNFTVTVSYQLVSQPTGTLMIGFNNGSSPDISRMLDTRKIVDNGSGQWIFNVSSKVKNWGSEGDFFVYVNMSENPVPTKAWTPFANNKYILIPKK